jgi:hypothetical protein
MKKGVTRPSTGAPPEPTVAQVAGRRRNLVFLAVVLGMLLAALDQTIVATALPTVVADLGGAGHQSWVVTVMGASRPSTDSAATTRLPAGVAPGAGIGTEPTRPFRPHAQVRRPPPGQSRR